MTVRSDKVELVISAKDEASAILRDLFGGGAEVIAEMRGEIEALQKQMSDLTGTQRGQTNTLHELSAGNREVTDELQEQAEAAKQLYNIELELGARAANTEKERIELAREALALEREATLAQADALGASAEQRRAIDMLFLRLDMQAQAQAGATAATVAGTAATTGITLATRAAAFATGLLDKAWVSLKRALFIAPFVAIITEGVGLLVEAAREMISFGDAADSASGKVDGLADSTARLVGELERLNGLRNALASMGIFGVGTREEQLRALQGMAGEIEKLRGEVLALGFGEKIPAEKIKAIFPTYRLPGESEDRGAVPGLAGQAVRDAFAGKAIGQDAVLAFAEYLQARVDAASKALATLDQVEEQAKRGSRISLFDPTMIAGQQSLELRALMAGFSPDEFRDRQRVFEQADAARLIRLAMENDALGGQLGIPSLLGVTAPSSAGQFNLDAAIAAEQARLIAGNPARQAALRAEEQLNAFTAERLGLMQQLELSQDEQLELLQLQTDAQRQAVEMAQVAGQISEDQARQLLDLIDRLQSEGVGRISAGQAFAGGGSRALFDPLSAGRGQLVQAVDALDDRGVASLADAIKQTAINFDDAGAAAKAFGASVVNALMDIAAQWAALQLISGLFGGFGGFESFGAPGSYSSTAPTGTPSGGGLDVTFPSGGASGFLPSTFGGGGAGGGGNVYITVHAPVHIQAIDTRDFKARVSEVARHVGDTVARELDTNAGLRASARRVSRSAG